MLITASRLDPSHLPPADILAIPVSGSLASKPSGTLAILDKIAGGILSKAMAKDGFSGEEGSRCTLRATKPKQPTIVLIGTGRMSVRNALRTSSALCMQIARDERGKHVALILDAGRGGLAGSAAAAAEGALLGDYRFLKYRDADAKKHADGSITELNLLVFGTSKDIAAAQSGIKEGEIYARAAMLARGMVDEPSSEMTPTKMMEIAKAVCEGHPDRLSLQVFDREEMAKRGMGGVLAVAKGSDEPPFFLHLTYRPAKKSRRKLAIVGKGITFDSGGLSLKPAGGMEDMKIDMAGAAAMIGMMSALTSLDCEAEVHGIAAVCENMPSGKAVKPGDIARTMSGVTIEILNTDAEGRVTLADCLHYATLLKPDAIVDLATLTGACMVALGQEVAGLLCNDDSLAQELLDAADDAGERMWRLPLVPEYRRLVKSTTADLRNTAKSSYGGAITAGLFLERFVGGRRWAHLDIAGPAWAESDTVPYQPVGATGFGVRTLLEFVMEK